MQMEETLWKQKTHARVREIRQKLNPIIQTKHQNENIFI